MLFFFKNVWKVLTFSSCQQSSVLKNYISEQVFTRIHFYILFGLQTTSLMHVMLWVYLHSMAYVCGVMLIRESISR
jgi:hypothetical protein